MTQTIITVIIIVLCAFFIGRRFYRQWRAAVNPEAKLACSCGCSGCDISDCKEKTDSR